MRCFASPFADRPAVEAMLYMLAGGMVTQTTISSGGMEDAERTASRARYGGAEASVKARLTTLFATPALAKGVNRANR